MKYLCNILIFDARRKLRQFTFSSSEHGLSFEVSIRYLVGKKKGFGQQFK